MISRQKLIDKLNSYHYTAIGMRCGKKMTAEIIKGYHDHVIEVIESQPPADQWIPCSERLPEDGQTVPVTVVLWKEKRILSHATYHAEKPTYWHPYDWDGEGFYVHDSELGECKYEYVVAWLDAEPYKGVE